MKILKGLSSKVHDIDIHWLLLIRLPIVCKMPIWPGPHWGSCWLAMNLTPPTRNISKLQIGVSSFIVGSFFHSHLRATYWEPRCNPEAHPPCEACRTRSGKPCRIKLQRYLVTTISLERFLKGSSVGEFYGVSFHVAIVIVYTLVHQDVWQGAGNTSCARLKTKHGRVQKPCCLLPGATCEAGISLGQRGGIGFNPRISYFWREEYSHSCIYSWYSKARNEALQVVWNNDKWIYSPVSSHGQPHVYMFEHVYNAI